MYQKQVKGIIISTVSDDTSWIGEMQTDGVTVVAIEQALNVPTHRVCFNYYGGGYMAARYLVNMGHRDIAFVSPPLSYASRRQRLEQACRQADESEKAPDSHILHQRYDGVRCYAFSAKSRCTYSRRCFGNGL